MTILRKLIRDVLYDHEWGLFDSENKQHGVDYKGDAQWRCECGWTTLDHHNDKSEWIDHADHVTDELVNTLRILHAIDTLTRWIKCPE